MKENSLTIVKGVKFKNGSAKILKDENQRYFVEHKKYFLGICWSKKSAEFDSYETAEDRLIEIKQQISYW